MNSRSGRGIKTPRPRGMSNRHLRSPFALGAFTLPPRRKTQNRVRRPPVRLSGPKPCEQRPNISSAPAATAGPVLAMLGLPSC
jgi:hypothetical protein